MSRKLKFSSKWKMAKARVLKVRRCIAKLRKNFLHKVATTISQNSALLYIEKLQVRSKR